MTIAWNLLTPWHALAGGLLIGLASALYMLGNGRVAGIAGIVASPLRALLSGTSMAPERTRMLFIGWLLIAPWIWCLFAPLPTASLDVGTAGLMAAGLFVGVGVRMGNGCTSGHGVCGLSRFSPRSLVRVLAFTGPVSRPSSCCATCSETQTMRNLIALPSGLVLGLGLIAGGMTDPAKVKGSLDLFDARDPSLALVVGGAIAVGVFAFAAAKRRTTSWTGGRMEIPTITRVDTRLVAGGMLFGIGWGIAGFCPGPAIVALASGLGAAWIFVAAMLVGMLIHDRVFKPR